MDKTELLTQIHNGWDDFNAYLKTLTEAQLTGPTDAVGWTAKDHIIHLAVWEDGVCALLRGQPRQNHVGVDDATWESGDYDKINAVIRQRHQDKSLKEALAMLESVHRELMEKIEALSDDDLQLPYHHFEPSSQSNRPVMGLIIGNTYMHYAEHKTWINAIVEKGEV